MKQLIQNLEPLEREIMEKANFNYICMFNGMIPLRTCISDAVLQITHLSSSQFCSVFGIFQQDIDNYVDSIYKKMKELGAEDE